MKKRLISAVLVVMLAMSSFPISASATNTDDLVLADLGTRYEYVNMFSDNVALARGEYEDGRYEPYEFINAFGEVVLDVSDYMEVCDFCDGLAYFEKDTDGDNQADYCGYMDKTGEEIIASSSILRGRDFSDGVACMVVSEGSGRQYVLIDTTGTILARYDYYDFLQIHDYHEGLCYVRLATGEQYFMDKEGNIALSVDEYDGTYIGDFYEGVARVLIREEGKHFASWFGFIDKTGEVLFSIDVPEDIVYRASDFSDGITLINDDSNNIYYYYNIDGELIYTLKYPESGGEWSFGKGGFSYFDGLTYIFYHHYGTGEKYRSCVDTNGNEVFRQPTEWEVTTHGYGTFSCGVTMYERNGNIILVRNPLYTLEDIQRLSEGLEPIVTTYGQSDISLYSAGAADMTYNQFDVLVTNNTDNVDKGTFALVVSSDRATVRIEEYEVAPHSSEIITITEKDHFANNTEDMFMRLADGWEGVINASIIKFESDADMAEYKSLIVDERNKGDIDGMYPSNEKSTLVCLGTPGENWLKTYAGITYVTAPYIYPEHDHSICGK